MTISIITPLLATHDISPTYVSLQAQTDRDWEWIVARAPSVAMPAIVDPRVHVIDVPPWVVGLGQFACFHFGCEKASGSVLLDLAVDDALLPGALTQVNDALLVDQHVSLVYGDFQTSSAGIVAREHPSIMGWETYGAEGDERELVAIRSFELTASSLHHPAFAPSRGVFWRREAYFEIASELPSAASASLYELVCRAYLSGRVLCRLDSTLLRSDGPTGARRDLALDQDLSNRYVYDLIREWCRRTELPMLDLGAAHNPAPGFVSVDLQDAEINCDIRLGLPMPDNSVGCIRACDFLEHMDRCPDSTCTHGADGVSPRCAVGVMNELYRVLAPGGWLISQTPSSDGRGAFQDPTHVSYWNPNSFWYYTRSDQSRFVRGITCRFQGTRVWQTFPTDWHRVNNIPYVFAELVALKGQRQPGVCEI